MAIHHPRSLLPTLQSGLCPHPSRRLLLRATGILGARSCLFQFQSPAYLQWVLSASLAATSWYSPGPSLSPTVNLPFLRLTVGDPSSPHSQPDRLTHHCLSAAKGTFSLSHSVFSVFLGYVYRSPHALPNKSTVFKTKRYVKPLPPTACPVSPVQFTQAHSFDRSRSLGLTLLSSSLPFPS